jgi:cytochrome P450
MVRAYMGRESLNVYMRQMCSVRFSEQMTPKYQDVRACLENIFQRISGGNPADYISLLKLAGKPKILDEMEEWSDKMYGHIRGWIQDHKKELNPSEPKDFLDVMLVKHKELGLSEQDVEVIMWDVLAGGIDTTATTMEWLMYIMCNYPETQRKCQEELDRVVGKDRLPTFEDRPKLPYLNAVLLELLRWKHFAPFGLPHMTLKDTEVLGYKIPAGAQVFIDFSAIGLDPKAWKDPEQWRPERFLEEEKDLSMSGPNGIHDAFFGDAKPTPESHKLIPFGAGKRKCVGTGIGRVVLWCKAATYLHCFNFEAPSGKLNIDDEFFGVTIMPHEQAVRVKSRPAARLLQSCEKTFKGANI